jgi:hypothetical protein
LELFGQHGAPELARQLGIPTWTWLGYEVGGSAPGPILVRLVEVTPVHPIWLLCGEGPMYRDPLSPWPELYPPIARPRGTSSTG